MQLLIDQNLSYRLVRLLSEQFPGTEHVSRAGLMGRRDPAIWEFAREHDYVILTQDEDFWDLSFLREAPPKVILLRTGNLPTRQIANLLLTQHLRIYTLLASDSDVNCLELP